LTVVGDGEERAALEHHSASLGISSRVDFLGELAPEHVREVLVSSRFLCLPSHSESFGIVMIEALACGVPVVGFAPTLGEVDRVVHTQCGVPIIDRSSRGITEALTAALDRSWNRESLRERAVKGFSPAAVTGRYVHFLQEVMDGSA